jgi:phage tail-like protein
MPPTGQSAPPLIPPSYFLVKIDTLDPIGAFMTCSGLHIEYDVLQYMEGGNNDYAYQLPGHIRYSNIVLTGGLTDKDNMTKWLDATKTEPQLKDVMIQALDQTKKPIRSWTFTEAFPVRWNGPSFDASAGGIATEVLEIAHSGLKAA